MRKYTIDEMKRAFECGRNFQLTGENNFTELIDELNKFNNITEDNEDTCDHAFAVEYLGQRPRQCIICGKIEI